jgi:hypothetical protein
VYLRKLIIAALLLLPAATLTAANTITRGTNLAVDAAPDGRLAVDLLGELWVIPGGGGEARQLTQDLKTAQRPRWSPDAQQLAYQATTESGPGIWLYDLATATTSNLSAGSTLDIHPDWHPDGERIVYASGRSGDGFDLWEVDLPTGLHWRISDHPGDETEPAWSADGRSLVYVLQQDDRWSLLLRRHGGIEEVLLTSSNKIAAPTFRPDGSLITFFETREQQVTLNMIILSVPRLIRKIADNERFVATPVSWMDRQQMIYSTNGTLRQRQFGSWSSRVVNFSATVTPAPRPPDTRVRPELSWSNQPLGELTIHAYRVFDGVGSGYLYDQDIVIRGGRIASLGAHANHVRSIVIDMGDLTVLPGFIDADARLPDGMTASHGPDLLTMGITTIVGRYSDDNKGSTLNSLWSAKDVPGPRLLDAARWPLGHLSRPELDVTAAVTGSRPAGQTTGLALANQFRSLARAGLTPAQSLRAIGVNAAAALLADPFLGRIATGASADLVFVDGDPLAKIADALNVVAVVRNGRFYSVSGLLDRAKAAENVE